MYQYIVKCKYISKMIQMIATLDKYLVIYIEYELIIPFQFHMKSSTHVIL
jgi:hypothetical protein